MNTRQAINLALSAERNVFARDLDGQWHRIYRTKVRRGILMGQSLHSGGWFVIAQWEERL